MRSIPVSLANTGGALESGFYEELSFLNSAARSPSLTAEVLLAPVWCTCKMRYNIRAYGGNYRTEGPRVRRCEPKGLSTVLLLWVSVFRTPIEKSTERYFSECAYFITVFRRLRRKQNHFALFIRLSTTLSSHVVRLPSPVTFSFPPTRFTQHASVNPNGLSLSFFRYQEFLTIIIGINSDTSFF